MRRASPTPDVRIEMERAAGAPRRVNAMRSGCFSGHARAAHGVCNLRGRVHSRAVFGQKRTLERRPSAALMAALLAGLVAGLAAEKSLLAAECRTLDAARRQDSRVVWGGAGWPSLSWK